MIFALCILNFYDFPRYYLHAFIIPIRNEEEGFTDTVRFLISDYSLRSQQAECLNDLVPVTELALGPACAGTSGTSGSLDLTGGEYKTWERIHRGIADPRLLAIPASWGRVAAPNPNWGDF